MSTRARILRVRVWRVLTKRILASTRASLCKYPMLTSHGFCIRCHLYQNIPGPILDALVVNTNLQIVLASGSIRYKMSQAYSQSFQSQNFLQQNKNKVQKNSFSGSMFLLCVINGFEIRCFLSKSYFVSILFLSTS